MKTKVGKNTKMKVLLVENNADEAEPLRKSLGEVASTLFDLTPAERLEEARQRVREESFDAVLLDLSLPDSQGLDTITKATQTARRYRSSYSPDWMMRMWAWRRFARGRKITW